MGKWQRLEDSSDVAGPNKEAITRRRALFYVIAQILRAESGKAVALLFGSFDPLG